MMGLGSIFTALGAILMVQLPFVFVDTDHGSEPFKETLKDYLLYCAEFCAALVILSMIFSRDNKSFYKRNSFEKKTFKKQFSTIVSDRCSMFILVGAGFSAGLNITFNSTLTGLVSAYDYKEVKKTKMPLTAILKCISAIIFGSFGRVGI